MKNECSNKSFVQKKFEFVMQVCRYPMSYEVGPVLGIVFGLHV